MSLLSPGLIVVLVALVVGCVAGAVLSWPRLARPGVLAVLGRLGVLAGVNVSVLLLAFALLNDQYEFFSEWSDFLATTSTQGTTTGAGADPSLAAETAVPVAHRSMPLERSTVLSVGYGGTTYAVTGAVSGVTSQVLVVLPPGYDAAANAGRRYPVLEGFSGYPGVVSQLDRAFHVPEALASAQAQHLVGPSIAVFVLPWSPPGRDTECVNGPGGKAAGDQVETWAAVDVPAWVHQHFRAASGRGSWATWGVSAGAYCAAMVTMLHPDTFSAAISFAGYDRPDWGNWVPFAPGDPGARRYDLVALARRDPPPVALWLFVSRHDRLAFPAASALISAARPPLSVTARISSVGGHGYLWWTPWFPSALAWLGHNLPGFRPSA